MNNKIGNKINTNNNSITKLRLGILTISVITVLMISTLSVTQYAYATDAPVITSLIVDDPNDLDAVYSVGDTITIIFDSDTNTPGGTSIQTKGDVNDLFDFSESIGQRYRGQWTAADTFTITINSISNAGILIGTTTVMPTEPSQIFSADGLSEPSDTISPVLSGDFGVPPFQNPWLDGNGGVIYYDGGNVGIGTTLPNHLLSVSGIIESTSGGFKFPDGTTQSTASTGDITGVTAGTGLSGGGTSGSVTLNVDTSSIQNRVTGSCSAGSSIRTINSGGGVTCEIDDVGNNLWTQSGSGVFRSHGYGSVGIGSFSNTAFDGEMIVINNDSTQPGIELRDRDSDGGSPYIDFTKGDNDFDVRLALSGGQDLVILGDGNLIANVVVHSSQKWKQDITPLDNTLDKVTQIQGVTYQWRADEFPEMSFDDTTTQIGFIAEELELIYPELVYTSDNGDKSISYSKLTPILLEAIKEQQNSIEEQQDILEQLKTVICPKHPELSACQ